MTLLEQALKQGIVSKARNRFIDPDSIRQRDRDTRVAPRKRRDRPGIDGRHVRETPLDKLLDQRHRRRLNPDNLCRLRRIVLDVVLKP